MVANELKDILESADHSCIVPADRRKTVEDVYINSPDLIVLDVEMPHMNGYTFMGERTKIPGGALAPVIVLTAYDSMEPIFGRLGIACYLHKPLKLQDLLLKIKEVLGDANKP